jgi:hypothetical protein
MRLAKIHAISTSPLDADVASFALDCLHQYPDKEFDSDLEHIVRDSPSTSVRERAVDALIALPGVDGVNILVGQMLRSKTIYERSHYLEELVALGDRRAIPFIEQALVNETDIAMRASLDLDRRLLASPDNCILWGGQEISRENMICQYKCKGPNPSRLVHAHGDQCAAVPP